MKKIVNKRIMIFPGHFFPDETSGGPAVSILNMSKLISNYFDIFIVASGRRFLDNSKLDVQTDEWIQEEKYKILFLKKYSIKKLMSLIKTNNPNYIYLNSFYSIKWSFIPILISKFVNTKIVLATRGNFSHKKAHELNIKKYIYRIIIKYILKPDTLKWHFTSDYEYQLSYNFLKGYLKKDNVYIIENIHLNESRVPNRYKHLNSLKIIYFGRIHPKKNIKLAVRTVNSLGYLKNLEFDLYGTVEDSKYFQEISDMFNENIRYRGSYAHKDVNTILMNYDVFLFLTQGENYGHTIAESLSNGIPVITSKNSPWSSIDKTCGFIVDIDSMDQCKSALLEFYQMTNDEWQKFSSQSIKLIRSNDTNKLIQKYLEMFN